MCLPGMCEGDFEDTHETVRGKLTQSRACAVSLAMHAGNVRLKHRERQRQRQREGEAEGQRESDREGEIRWRRRAEEEQRERE